MTDEEDAAAAVGGLLKPHEPDCVYMARKKSSDGSWGAWWWPAEKDEAEALPIGEYEVKRYLCVEYKKGES